MGVPVGTPVANSSGNAANAGAVATLPAVPNKTTFISSVQFSSAGATVGLPVVATIAGLLGGTLSYIFCAPAGALIGAPPLVLNFDPPLPASGQNVPIVCTLPALGAGNTNAAASANGFQA
jgi:hypothetical protein